MRLPPLTAEVGHAEMFIHDSLHTAKNTLFEMERSASVLSPAGLCSSMTSARTTPSRPSSAESGLPDHHLPVR